MPGVDVCIIGSGPGGGAMAHALTAAGLNVLILERGNRYHTRDFEHSHQVGWEVTESAMQLDYSRNGMQEYDSAATDPFDDKYVC